MRVRRAVDLADRAVSAAAAAPMRPWLEPMRRASAYGNGMALWGVVAGGLATRPAHRRAVVSGLASMATASAMSNGVAKRISDRPRPLNLPIRGTQKRSASMPSSHAATAAAFATAVTIESPGAGTVVVPIALAVAAMRVYGRQHTLLDVSAGLTLGAATGAVVALGVRVARHRRHRGSARLRAAGAEPGEAGS
jgi:membrane-associated phospholipid phosphatase